MATSSVWKLSLAVLLAVTAAAQSKPNPVLTPGLSRSMTKEQICTTKWGLDRRFLTHAMKEQVCKAYGLTDEYCFGRTIDPETGKSHPNVEFDHLIPRELAGADDPKNLWPQPWLEARVKDVIENELHKAFCSGVFELRDAQNRVKEWYDEFSPK